MADSLKCSASVRCSGNAAHFTRIEKVLEYIHQHLFLPLSLENIAQKSCWSRWQLQRVFRAETGLNVAQYIREIKLSGAAETLLQQPNERILDVALAFGFNSEISFSRAFKQFFHCSPRDYRKQGIRTGLRQPIALAQFESTQSDVSAATRQFTQIRVESKDELQLVGCHGEISGLFASEPNFQTQVPAIWQTFERTLNVNSPPKVTRFGVIDTLSMNAECLSYWASMEYSEFTNPPSYSDQLTQGSGIKSLTIPKQQYAVLTHYGPIHGLKSKLEWLFTHWLPQSGYRGIDGFELEIYPHDYQAQDDQAQMEYWLPIEAVKTHI
ncbi:AraC family transcriptional regulator [Vibrio gangliei]|uniref:AraC family transcriptional regulator n=1 Tax=Vibrio gangliei TaxID=2077090 RepID=UPI001FE6A9CF|nr:helix-turn-helix domain-containing protein [Vibrio gangliei]